jgi:hypothetical protein
MGTAAQTCGAVPYAAVVSDDAANPASDPQPESPAPLVPGLPELTPLDPPTVPFAIGGIILWAIIGLALLPFRHSLAAHGRSDWLWICLAGFVVGFPGLFTMIRHDRHRRARRATRSDSDPSAPLID